MLITGPTGSGSQLQYDLLQLKLTKGCLNGKLPYLHSGMISTTQVSRGLPTAQN